MITIFLRDPTYYPCFSAVAGAEGELIMERATDVNANFAHVPPELARQETDKVWRRPLPDNWFGNGPADIRTTLHYTDDDGEAEGRTRVGYGVQRFLTRCGGGHSGKLRRNKGGSPRHTM